MDNLLVSDKDINVSKSPFSAYTNEKMIYDGRLNPIPLDHIMFKVKRGHIFSTDFIILEALSKLEFATSRMVTQYLTFKNINIPQEKVSNRLKVMNKLNIISRYRFKSDDGEASFRAYCLERAGKILLISRNYKCDWKPTDSIRPLEVVKQILARNQILLSYLNKVNNIDSYEINPTIKLPTTGQKFMPNLSITLNVNEEKEVLFFEVFRSYEGYKETVVQRLSLYQQFYNYFTPINNINKLPQLIIVGEDDKHLFEIFKVIVSKHIEFKNVKPLFTSDLRVLEENLRNSIIDFNIKKNENDSKVKVQINVLDYKKLM